MCIYPLCLYLFFTFFHDTVGQDEGKTNHVVKYTILSFMTSVIYIRFMVGFLIQNFKYTYHIFYWDFYVLCSNYFFYFIDPFVGAQGLLCGWRLTKAVSYFL